jgi:hypothetical protein
MSCHYLTPSLSPPLPPYLKLLHTTYYILHTYSYGMNLPALPALAMWQCHVAMRLSIRCPAHTVPRVDCILHDTCQYANMTYDCYYMTASPLPFSLPAEGCPKEFFRPDFGDFSLPSPKSSKSGIYAHRPSFRLFRTALCLVPTAHCLDRSLKSGQRHILRDGRYGVGGGRFAVMLHVRVHLRGVSYI